MIKVVFMDIDDTIFDFSTFFEPNALELIKYLDRKYIMCVASNAPYEQQMNRLKIGGIDSFFSYAFISSIIGVKKGEKL